MIGSDFDTPIMYQDLANYTMPNMPFGNMTGYSNTNYLGGVQMRPQADHDEINLKEKKNEEAWNTFKKAGIALGVLATVCFIPSAFKKVKKAGGIIPFFKNIFKGNAEQTTKKSLWQKVKAFLKRKPKNAAGANQQPSKWSKVKNRVSNRWEKVKGKPHKWQRFKAWSGNKWDAFKNLFHKNKTTPNP